MVESSPATVTGLEEVTWVNRHRLLLGISLPSHHHKASIGDMFRKGNGHNVRVMPLSEYAVHVATHSDTS